MAYKKPRARMVVKVTLVRLLTCKFQIIGTGRSAKRTSVMMLTTAKKISHIILVV